MQKFWVPKLYLSDYVANFEDKITKYHLVPNTFQKGTTLTTPGVINNTAHYVQSGTLHLSLTHSSGNMKSLTFFGPKTVFPLGVVPHENLIDYEMVLEAFTDVTVYSFSYPDLRQMCVDDGNFAAELLEENCDFIGYLFYHEMNSVYASSYVRVCDILFLYYYHIHPVNTCISISQDELARLAGVSIAQLERILKSLREQSIIQTSRKMITILDKERLLQQCSDELKKHPMNDSI